MRQIFLLFGTSLSSFPCYAAFDSVPGTVRCTCTCTSHSLYKYAGSFLVIVSFLVPICNLIAFCTTTSSHLFSLLLASSPHPFSLIGTTSVLSSLCLRRHPPRLQADAALRCRWRSASLLYYHAAVTSPSLPLDGLDRCIHAQSCSRSVFCNRLALDPDNDRRQTTCKEKPHLPLQAQRSCLVSTLKYYTLS